MVEPIPRIGVAVIIKQDDRVLIGKRIGAHGKDCWGFPGGHLEFGETIFACAAREAEEEAGVTITRLERLAVTEDFFTDTNKHYLTVFVTASIESGIPTVREPDKCAGWEWHSWDALPSPRFLPIDNLQADGINPFTQDSA